MNRDQLIRRISEALDSPDGLEGDLELQRLFVRDPAASDLADELASVDRALRRWPEPFRSEQAWEALATRIEQRLDEPLPAMADPTAPPRLPDGAVEDDDGADRAAAAAPAATATGSGEFSLASLTGDRGGGEPPRAEDGDRFSFSDLAVVRPRVAGGIPSLLDVQPQAPEPPPRRRAGTGVWIGGALAAAAAVALAVVGGTATLSDGSEEPAATASDAPSSAEPALAREVPAGALPAAPRPYEPASRRAERTAGDAVAARATAAEPASVEAARAARRFARGPEEEREPGSPRRARARRAAASTRERVSRGTGSPDRAGGEATGEPARDDAEREEGGGRPPAAADPGSLPETPDRDSIVAVMRAVEPLVRACAGEQRGVATVEVTVGSSGRVRSALVTGFFSGTPEGSCVARAVRRARFPEFRRPTFSFTYRFQL